MQLHTQGKINKDLYILGTPTNPVYLFSVKGTWVLVEGGIAMDTNILIKQLNSILPSFSLVKYWFITHSHFDHCGLLFTLLPLFRDRPTVFASKTCIENFRLHKYEQRIRNLNKVAEFDINGLSESQPFFDIDFVALNGSVEIEGQRMLVIETPGHSNCLVSLWWESEGYLFVSDALGELMEEDNWFPLPFFNVDAYMKSINMLSLMQPSMLCIGHHGALSQKKVSQSFVHSLVSTNKVIDEISQMVKTEHSTEVVAKKLTQKYAHYSQRFLPQELHLASMSLMISLLKKENYIL